MKIYNILILFYIVASFLLGIAFLIFSLHLIELQEVILRINEMYSNVNLRIELATGGIFIILVAILFAQVISGRYEREKTIAFNNPSGQVTITLYAIEDLIRRLSQELPQIKEIKPDVVATKKRGIQVNIRLVLKSETNIPEFTAQLQEIIRNKIQETLNIDEQIAVKIHIAKILTPQQNLKAKDSGISQEQKVQIPYPRV